MLYTRSVEVPMHSLGFTLLCLLASSRDAFAHSCSSNAAGSCSSRADLINAFRHDTIEGTMLLQRKASEQNPSVIASANHTIVMPQPEGQSTGFTFVDTAKHNSLLAMQQKPMTPVLQDPASHPSEIDGSTAQVRRIFLEKVTEKKAQMRAMLKRFEKRFMDAFRIVDRWREAKDLRSLEPLLRPLERGLQGAMFVFLFFLIVMLILPGSSGLGTLLFLKSDPDDKATANNNAIRVMAEHGLRKPEATNMQPLEVFDIDSSVAGPWYFVPMAVTVLSIAIPITLMHFGYGYCGMLFTIFFVAYVSWKLAFHVTFCSCVGIKKVRIYEKADFQAIYRQEQAHPIPRRGPRWDDIMHFVIIVNYKEDLETMQSAIGSVAASPMAKSQIGLVLAMEEREVGAADKANSLVMEFSDKFKHVFATFHPPDLPGEVPGKPSNTNWAAGVLFNEFVPEHGIDIGKVVVTVMDADSEFHPQYFSALTYSFAHAGGEENETPDRYLTIWQPPILHYKNFLRQPALVRLASWVTSEHELANLADPYCTKWPYSTYSISAELAKKVNGWDADWISEDQHMALKCFLATGGRLQVQPIFLSVMNYAPECDTLLETLNARWAQAKRHALGYGEIVYMLGKISSAMSQISSSYERLVFLWRSFWIVLKMLTIHLFFATSFLIGPLTGSFFFYFYRHLIGRALLPVYCVFQMVMTISLNWGIVVSVLVYAYNKDRVEGSDNPPFRFRSHIVHCFFGFVQYNVLLPMLWCFGAAAEWIAAFKLMGTHKFDHEVAAKPTALADKYDKDSSEFVKESS